MNRLEVSKMSDACFLVRFNRSIQMAINSLYNVVVIVCHLCVRVCVTEIEPPFESRDVLIRRGLNVRDFFDMEEEIGR